jgi:hypothetical protein
VHSICAVSLVPEAVAVSSTGLCLVLLNCRHLVAWALALYPVDYDRKAVVVEYEEEIAVMDDFGEILRVERKPHRKLYVWLVRSRRLCERFVVHRPRPLAHRASLMAAVCYLVDTHARTFHSINLKKLDEHTNIELLAQDIMEHCDKIHPSKMGKLIGSCFPRRRCSLTAPRVIHLTGVHANGPRVPVHMRYGERTSDCPCRQK